jgi:hypothetical protein
MIIMPPKVDTNDIRVTNAIASVINGAFETGINPAWFEVESLSKGGFLDAAFAGPDLDATASGKPAIKDWTLKARLNYDSFKSKWVTLTPEVVVERWSKYAFGRKSGGDDNIARNKVMEYLMYLSLLSLDADRADDYMMDTYEPDGVHDDFMAQVAIAEEVIFG